MILGHLKNPSNVPVLEERIIVETDQNVFCFDSDAYGDFGKVIIDCVKSTVEGKVNLFYFVDVGNKSVSVVVQN